MPAAVTLEDPDRVVETVRGLSDEALHHLAEVVRQVRIERAVGAGDQHAFIGATFESGFGRDGLAVRP
jgi:predicted NAD/FAD-binding protein